MRTLSRFGATAGRVAMLGLVFLWPAPPAEAQGRFDQRRYDLRGPPPVEAEPRAFEAEDAYHRARLEQAAARLLESARQNVALGRRDMGQRLLELLIARYPDSRIVTEARRELFALYAADARVGQGTAARGTDPAGSGPAAPAAPDHSPAAGAAEPATAAAPAPGPPLPRLEPGGGWRTSIVAHRRLQDELRSRMGDRVFFGPASAELGSRARALLAAQADWLLRRPDVEVIVEGHADDAAAGADDEQIAAARAAAVRDRLVAEGVEPGRVNVVSFGATDRIADCADTDCAAQNRRVVVRVGTRAQHGAVVPPEPAESRGLLSDVRR